MVQSRSLCLSFLLLTLAVPAVAQTPRAMGPFGGLFGGVGSSGQTLDLRGSVFGLYQETSLPESATSDVLDPQLDLKGSTSGASASLGYAFRRTGPGSSIHAGARGSASMLSSRPDDLPVDVAAATGFSTQLGRRTTFSAGGDGFYSPYSGFPNIEQGYTPALGFGPDNALLGQPGQQAVRFEPTIVFGGNAALTANLTPRTTFSAIGDLREHRLLDRKENNTRSYTAGGVVSHQLFRYLSVRGGYRRQVTDSALPGAERAVSDILDAGVDFNYAGGIQLDRRTTLRFGTSSAFYSTTTGGSHFRLNGNAGISRGIGRTWAAMVDYVRDAGYQVGFNDIVLSDTASASLSGLVLPRVSSSSSLSWQRGAVGFNSGVAYKQYGASTALNFGLTRMLGLYAQYSQFHYNVPAAATTLPFFERYSRRTVSAGLTAFVPLINTGRRTRDSR